jgi:hypothetical protein
MATSYTSLLGLALPVTGELSGTWGDTVNNYITQYTDASIAGTQTISGSQTAVTLSVTNGTSLSQAGSGATGSAQYQVINCTGNPAGLLTITAPASSKTYIVINATSTSQSVKIVGTGPTTGVTVASGQRALVAWNGSDFVQVGASAGGSTTQVQYNNGGALAGSANLTFDGTTLTANALTLTNKLTIANGGTNATATPTAGAVAYGTGSAYAFTSAGTSGQALVSNGASAPSFGTLGVAGGGTGATTLTANNVILGNGTSAVQFVAPGTNGNVLVSNGTTWTSAAPAASGVSQAKATAIAMIFGI